MIKTIIFDLDRCIFNTPAFKMDQFIPQVLEAIKKADINHEISEEKFQVISRELWMWGLDGIIKWNHIPDHIASIMKQTFTEPTAELTITPFDDVTILEKLPQTKILVTTGHEIFQSSKIKNLKIEKYFKEIIINKTDTVLEKITKKHIFEEILNKYDWKPNEIMVVGDNPDDELKAGKELGMVTVQSLRPTVVKVDGFDYYLNSFTELPTIINNMMDKN
jgi:putative hydrolase of the HAD superfamily